MSRSSLPNIVVVFADQLRGFDLGVAGNPDVKTPCLDRLASEGVHLRRAYCNSAVCTPSRATMLTGLYPTHHRAVGNDLPLPEEIPSIARTLRGAGYRTGYVGKWHLDGVPRSKFTPPGPRRHGFDDFWAAYNCSHNYFGARYYRDSPDAVPITGYEPRAQTELAVEFLESCDEQPFCLFLSWGPPHDPYDQVPSEFRARYEAASLRFRENVAHVVEGAESLADGLDPGETVANYYAAISALDHEVGRLLEALHATGRDKDTIVVFTSDHGDMLFSHGRVKKQQPEEESINVPLIARWPGRIPAATVSDELISLVDLAPTLLSLAGVRTSDVMDGADRSALLLGGKGGGAKSVFIMDLVEADEGLAQGIPEWRGVRTERYTCAVLADGTPWVLYDNEADPWQRRNLVHDRDSEPVLNEMLREIQRWRDRTGDHYHSGQECLADLGLSELWRVRNEHARAFMGVHR